LGKLWLRYQRVQASRTVKIPALGRLLMPQTSAINLIAVSLLLSMSSPALAQPPAQYAQAQQMPSQTEQDFQNRMRAAKTPEERAGIQAEHDRMMQQGAVPKADTNVRTGPGTAQDASPGGGGSVPRGQSGGGGAGAGAGGESGSGGSGGSR
jgi:hypothetical protein